MLSWFMSYQQSLNSLSFWYPMLKNMGLPTPKTHIIHTTGFELVKMIDNYPIEEINWLQKLIDEIGYYAEKVGYPCFLRTGHTSNKHDWKDSCYITKKEDIHKNLYSLVEMSAMADFPLDFFVVREMLETKPHFNAFNGMPITKEVRCFIEKDKITVTKYWPHEAFKDTEKKKVDSMYNFTKEDIDTITSLLTFIHKSIDPIWCVDLLETKDGWVVIDMSTITHSYKNEEEGAIILEIKTEWTQSK